MAPFIAKKGNTATQASLVHTREIPYYTDASFSAFAWKTNLTNHTKSLNDTCVPLFTVMSERYSIPKVRCYYLLIIMVTAKWYVYVFIYTKMGIRIRLHLKLWLKNVLCRHVRHGQVRHNFAWRTWLLHMYVMSVTSKVMSVTVRQIRHVQFLLLINV